MKKKAIVGAISTIVFLGSTGAGLAEAHKAGQFCKPSKQAHYKKEGLKCVKDGKYWRLKHR